MKIGPAGIPHTPYDASKAFSVNREHLSNSPQEQIDRVTKARLLTLYGRIPSATRNETGMERLRRWSANNPRLSTTAAMASIVALSTSLALISGWAIDELAHLTDRKNDKVGVVFGAVVGLAMAITQTVQLFSLARRGAIRSRANAFSPDSHTTEGQSYALIRERNPVLLHAIRSNARSEMGHQNIHLKFNTDDVYQAMNTFTKEGWGRAKWEHVLEEKIEEPAAGDNRPYFQATVDSKTADFKAGRYYVSKFSNVNDFLDAEITEVFSSHKQIIGDIVNAAKAAKAAKTGEKAAVNASQLIADAKEALLHNAGKSSDHGIAELEKSWDGKTFDSFLSKLSALNKEELDEFARGSKLLSRENTKLRRELFTCIDQVSKNPVGRKSWVRVDELTKIGPAIQGLRPASMHSFIQNFRDCFFSFAESMDANTQGRAAGNSIFSFVPFALLVSVVGVLCLGMSSTSTVGGADPHADTSDHKDFGLGVFPAFENGSQTASAPAPQQQQAPVAYPTPMMQAMQAPSGMYSVA